jgi:hypothetical protein
MRPEKKKKKKKKTSTARVDRLVSILLRWHGMLAALVLQCRFWFWAHGLELSLFYKDLGYAIGHGY